MLSHMFLTMCCFEHIIQEILLVLYMLHWQTGWKGSCLFHGLSRSDIRCQNYIGVMEIHMYIQQVYLFIYFFVIVIKMYISKKRPETYDMEASSVSNNRNIQIQMQGLMMIHAWERNTLCKGRNSTKPANKPGIEKARTVIRFEPTHLQ